MNQRGITIVDTLMAFTVTFWATNLVDFLAKRPEAIERRKWNLFGTNWYVPAGAAEEELTMYGLIRRGDEVCGIAPPGPMPYRGWGFSTLADPGPVEYSDSSSRSRAH